MPAASHDIFRLRQALAGHYTVDEAIGAGATAVVYRATDVRHDRVVALKVLRNEIAAHISVDRFLREIRTLARLAHPNILPLFESGQADGFLYYAMPLVKHSLRDRIVREKFLPLEDVLQFAREIGEALDFAHAQKIIHRDIKPANILIEAGHAVVADFGISKALDEASAGSTEHFAIGTPAYMSPEQAIAEPNLDGRSDLYALACTTYEMLAGSVPFSGPTAGAIQARKTQEQMPPLITVRPTLPASIEEAVRRGLSVVPADRFPTAKEFVAALIAPTLQPASQKKRSTIVPVMIAGVLVISAGAILATHFLNLTLGDTDPATRIAVARFANYTRDSTRDDVGFMALDEITEGLQRLPSLSVVPMQSIIAAVASAGNTNHDTSTKAITALSQETGATAVLSGSYYIKDDSLSVHARVTDAATGKVLVAIGPFSAPLAHPELAIERIRTRAMGYFATTSDDRLAGQQESRATAPTYEAYRAFSAGMSAYTSSRYAQALLGFNAAISADSSFATPRLFASMCLSNLHRYAEADSVAHSLAGMREHLNPYYQDWLDYRLAFLAGDNAKALKFARRVAARAPGTKAVFNWALAAQEAGYVDEALRAIHSLPPDHGAMREWVPYWDEVGTAYHLKSDFRAELDAGAKATAMYADRQYALLPSIRALAALGRADTVAILLGRAARLPDESPASTLGMLYGEAGLELRAHGHTGLADTMFVQAALWYERRIASRLALRADSIGAATWLYETARYREAIELLPAQQNDVESLALAGLIAARTNHIAVARDAMARLANDNRPYQRGAPQIAHARIAALLGDSADALSAVNAALAAGKEYSLWIHRTAEFASLKSDSRFIAILRPRN